MLGAISNISLKELNPGSEHDILTKLIKSLNAEGDEWSPDDLAVHLNDLLQYILPSTRKLPVAYFTLLALLMERLIRELRERSALDMWQVRAVQFGLLQRFMQVPLADGNLLPFTAAMRDLQLLSFQARDCLVDGLLGKLSTVVSFPSAKSLLSDLPIIFHHLLQLGDSKVVIPVIQEWLSKGAHELAAHLLFLAGQNVKLIDAMFKATLKAPNSLDPLSFAVLLQMTRLPGLPLNARASKMGLLRAFLAHRSLLHTRHQRLRSILPLCTPPLPASLLTAQEFLCQVAKWLPDTEQSILAAIELINPPNGEKLPGSDALLERLFVDKPFARRELLKRTGTALTPFLMKKLQSIDPEIVNEFTKSSVKCSFLSHQLGSEYALTALKAAPIAEALKVIEEAEPGSLPIPAVIEDWCAIEDAQEAALLTALLIKQSQLSEDATASLFQLCELLWLGRDACPIGDEQIRFQLISLAVHFCSSAGRAVPVNRIAALSVDSPVKLHPLTAKQLLSLPGIISETELFMAALEGINGDVSDVLLPLIPSLPLEGPVLKALIKAQLPLNSFTWNFITRAAELSISQPASFTKSLTLLVDSVVINDDCSVIDSTSLSPLQSICDPLLVKALSRLLVKGGDTAVLEEIVKAAVIAFGAVQSETTDESEAGDDLFRGKESISSLLRGVSMNERATESLFQALLTHLLAACGEVDWIVGKSQGVELFVANWTDLLDHFLPTGIFLQACHVLSSGGSAVRMQNALTALYGLTEKILDACQRPEQLNGFLHGVAVQITRRVYLLLPLQEAGNNNNNTGSVGSGKKKLKGGNGGKDGKGGKGISALSNNSSSASNLIFALERFENKFMAKRVALGREADGWPQSLPRSTSRDFKILLENLN